MKRFPRMLPAPSAVQVFELQQTPESIVEDIFLLDDAVRALARFRLAFDGRHLAVEDQGDREEILAIHAEATKQLGKIPARVGSHLRSLS